MLCFSWWCYIHVIPDPSRCQDLIDIKISKATTRKKIKNIHFLSPFGLKYGILNGENVIRIKEFIFQRAKELFSGGKGICFSGGKGIVFQLAAKFVFQRAAESFSRG